MDNFTKSTKVLQAFAPGSDFTEKTGDFDGVAIDLAGFNCATLLVCIGATTGANAIKIQESDQSAAGFVDVPSARYVTNDGSDNGTVLIELTHPLKRYVRAEVDLAAAGPMTVSGRWLLQAASYEPVDQPAGINTVLVH